MFSSGSTSGGVREGSGLISSGIGVANPSRRRGVSGSGVSGSSDSHRGSSTSSFVSSSGVLSIRNELRGKNPGLNL